MSDQPHRIRLRGHWEQTPTADGRVRHRRMFGRPRTIDASERVWLVCEQATGPAHLSLDGRAVKGIETAGRVEFDVTDHLSPRNEAVIEAASDLGEVSVEIRRGS